MSSTSNDTAIDPLVIAHAFTSSNHLSHHHLALRVGGRYAYETAGPTSTVRIDGIFVTPTRQLLGIHETQRLRGKPETFQGVEVEYKGLEVGYVLGTLARGDYVAFEHVFGGYRPHTMLIHGAPNLPDLHRLATNLLSLTHAFSMLEHADELYLSFENRQVDDAAVLLAPLRATLMTAYLAKRGEVVFSLRKLFDEFAPQFSANAVQDINMFMTQVRKGQPKIDLSVGKLGIGYMEEALNIARGFVMRSSMLPHTPPVKAIDAANEWLINFRLERQDHGFVFRAHGH
jgi:hypothetical protein